MEVTVCYVNLQLRIIRVYEVVKDVLEWFEYGIDFLNYGNPIEELRMAVSNSEDVKQLMLDMIQEMDLDKVSKIY